MSDVTLDTAALDQLNQDQKALLDTIDSLRTIGVDKYAPLPQLIVVGDQSSGKSSVLEAISRVRFPVKGGLCTRFATELVLRTAPKVKIDVKIKRHAPDSRSTSASDLSTNFSETRFSKDALPEIIEKAKRIMGIRDGTTSFSEDVLRVKISGPDLPELTVVDLPGFYETGTAEQSQEGRSVVSRLVQKYMSQSNSIILAVVSARAGLANQKVLREAKVHDPKRERTLGIVTKPDSVVSGSDDEEKYIQLIRNKEPEHTLKLGWHVLRNRAENEGGISDEERDAKETEFLQSGRWRQISFKDRGIEPLRKKLSKELVSHIQASLPGLIAKIEKHRVERHDRLTQLGRPRSSPDDLRIHLSGIAHQYEKIAGDAIEGTYRDSFFPGLYAGSSVLDESDVKRLRAVIRNMNRVFDALMSHKGSAESIILDNDGTSILSKSLELPDYLDQLADLYDVDDPATITLAEIKAKLEIEAAKTSGSEFPGSSNDNLALDLFKHESSRWGGIAQRHIDLLTDLCRSFVESLFDHIVGGDPSTRNAIITDRVNPFFNQCTIDLSKKLQELLHHYKYGPAMPLEAEFLERLGSKTKSRLANQVKALLKPMLSQVKGEDFKDEMIDDAVRRAPETDVTKFGVERIIDIMAVYYEVSLRTFVENVIVLAVENCLVQRIPSIFTSQDVAGMKPDKLEALAAESSDIQEERNELNRDLGVLNAALDQCRIYKPRGQMGLRQSLSSCRLRASTPSATPDAADSPIFSDTNLNLSVDRLSLSPATQVPASYLKRQQINLVGNDAPSSFQATSKTAPAANVSLASSGLSSQKPLFSGFTVPGASTARMMSSNPPSSTSLFGSLTNTSTATSSNSLPKTNVVEKTVSPSITTSSSSSSSTGLFGKPSSTATTAVTGSSSNANTFGTSSHLASNPNPATVTKSSPTNLFSKLNSENEKSSTKSLPASSAESQTKNGDVNPFKGNFHGERPLTSFGTPQTATRLFGGSPAAPASFGTLQPSFSFGSSPS